jgi:hypothetical protein
MDLYLPDEFYALSESPNARRQAQAHRDMEWLGGEAFVAPRPPGKVQPADPDPIWLVV